jgi:hypothetical protein
MAKSAETWARDKQKARADLIQAGEELLAIFGFWTIFEIDGIKVAAGDFPFSPDRDSLIALSCRDVQPVRARTFL